MLSRLLILESDVASIASLSIRKVALWQVDKSCWMSLGLGCQLVLLSVSLLVKANVIVLFKRALTVDKLRSGAAAVSTAITLYVLVPAFSQLAYVVIYSIAKLVPVVEVDD